MKIRWATQEEMIGEVKDYSKLFTSGSQQVIKNVATDYRVLRINENLFFPVTINNDEWENAFVCSPYAAYTKYAKEEVKWTINNKFLRQFLFFIINLLSGWLKRGKLNKNVHVNNYLLSTNPYPEWNGKEIPEITAFLKAEYPKHAIIFRSLNEYQHSKLLNTFRANEYDTIGSRQVYIYDLTKEEWLSRKNNKHDNRLIRKKGLTLLDHEKMEAFLPQALQLYNQLYLEKYTPLNPQFTLQYFKDVHKYGLVDFQGYIDAEGNLKAFSGQFTVDQTMTSPLIGYDINAPKKDALYIHASQLALLSKFRRNILLNLSSGAAGFKRMRGGIPSIEYSALFLNHLSRKRRIRWKVLQFVSNKIGLPVIKKYEL